MKRIFVLFSLLICIFSSSAFAQRSTLFPEFFSGSQESMSGAWICEMFFTNQDIYSVQGINIAFYDFDGNPAYVDSNLGNAASYTFDLNAGETKIIRVNPEAAYVEGYAVMTYPSSGAPVRATVVYRMEDGAGNVLADFGVPQQEFGSHYSFPVEMNNDPSQLVYTAVAVANPAIFSSSPQTMIFRLIGADGEIDATATKLMQPGEHFADYLYQASLFETYFSGLGGNYNYVGSLSVSSPFGVGVMAIRQDKKAFGAISTDGGPVLGPFALSSASVGEVEPNDSLGQAQLIVGSTVITGDINPQSDPQSDVDYFKITGQQGDILSVVCDAQLDESWLDSVLEIRDSSGTLIAENDQNGLSPEGYPLNDSFIQVVLPANDTYYIMLQDWFADGGPEYFYTLHVKIAAGN